MGLKPGFREMEAYELNRWKGLGLPTTHLLQQGVVLYDFPDLESRDRMLGGNWTLRGHPLILRPWVPGMNYQRMDVEKVPVWVQFLGLPLECWTPKQLGKIASFIGVPLATDRLTACRDRLAFARVLIDMKITDKLIWEVHVMTEGGMIEQQVVYEWRPVRCGRCKQLGHPTYNCLLPPRQAWVEKPAMEHGCSSEVQVQKGAEPEKVGPIQVVAVQKPTVSSQHTALQNQLTEVQSSSGQISFQKEKMKSPIVPKQGEKIINKKNQNQKSIWCRICKI